MDASKLAKALKTVAKIRKERGVESKTEGSIGYQMIQKWKPAKEISERSTYSEFYYENNLHTYFEGINKRLKQLEENDNKYIQLLLDEIEHFFQIKEYGDKPVDDINSDYKKTNPNKPKNSGVQKEIYKKQLEIDSYIDSFRVKLIIKLNKIHLFIEGPLFFDHMNYFEDVTRKEYYDEILLFIQRFSSLTNCDANKFVPYAKDIANTIADRVAKNNPLSVLKSKLMYI